VRTDGSGEVNRIIRDTANDMHPCWSPDGTRLAFTSDRTGNDEVWVVTLVPLATARRPSRRVTAAR